MKKIVFNNIDFLEYRQGSGETWEIFDIAVLSEREKGIGTSLINELIDRAKKERIKRIFAITRSSNKIAQRFYEANGFEANALMRFYPDEDAYMYIKTI